MIEGIEIKIRGKKYVLPPLGLGGLKKRAHCEPLTPKCPMPSGSTP